MFLKSRALPGSRTHALALRILASLIALLCFGCQKLNADDADQAAVDRDLQRNARVSITNLDEATTAEVRTVDDNGDGKADLILERIRRDGVLLFSSLWHRGRKTTARSYRAGGRLLMTETDTDGDGFLELLIFFDDQGIPIEAFKKSKEGTVVPLGKSEMTDVKAAYTFGDTVLEPYLESLRDAGKRTSRSTNSAPASTGSAVRQ